MSERSILRRLVFAAALVATFIVACLPPAEATTLGGSDKLDHVVAFAVLGTLAAWAYPRLRLSLILGGLALAGGAIELLQGTAFIGRDAEWADWYGDVAAAAITLAIIAAIRAFDRRA